MLRIRSCCAHYGVAACLGSAVIELVVYLQEQAELLPASMLEV